MLNIIFFIAEVMHLKAEPRTGWKFFLAAGETVTDHIATVSQIAFVLALLEGLDPFRCSAMASFHDNDESRLGDMHRLSQLYFNKRKASRLAVRDQLRVLPPKIRKAIGGLIKECHEQKTAESLLVKDADLLDVALQAKILQESGKLSQDWISWAEKGLSTRSARQILAEIKTMPDFTNCWWQEQKKKIMEKA